MADFGITGVVTDPTVVDSGSTTSVKPGSVRYMAPELLDPSAFGLPNSNPRRKSDVYSLAMTTYEVHSFQTVHGHRLHCYYVIRSSQRFFHIRISRTVKLSSKLCTVNDRLERKPVGYRMIHEK